MSDLISRQAAIDAINHICPIDTEYDCTLLDRVDVRYVLSDLSSAEPVRHGKFIGTEYDGYADGNPVYYEWKCSVCGCIFEDDEPTYNYCPHCGARMDKE